MAGGPADRHPGSVTWTPSPARLGVVDLGAHRRERERLVTTTAAAPVRHVPAELLEALLGSWGTPEELGLGPTRRHLQAVGS